MLGENRISDDLCARWRFQLIYLGRRDLRQVGLRDNGHMRAPALCYFAYHAFSPAVTIGTRRLD